MVSTYRLAVDVDVADVGSLWAVVNERLTETYGMSDDDVVETIGPREDPDVEQCLVMLLDPSRWLGCRIEHLECGLLSTQGAPQLGMARSPTRPLVIRPANFGSLPKQANVG